MQKTKWIKHASAIAITAFVVLAISGIFLLKNFFHADEARPKKMIQQITVITPPPPPPPPPPEQIKPPEIKEQIKEAETPPDKPQEKADSSPAPEQDPNASGEGPTIAAGTGGDIGAGGFGGGYDQFVRQEVGDWLAENDKLKHMAYVAVVTLWVSESGELTRIEVEQREGMPEVKKIIELALQEKRRLSKGRPLEAGDRITLRLKSVLE
jgi:periplasmic protein TonB